MAAASPMDPAPARSATWEAPRVPDPAGRVGGGHAGSRAPPDPGGLSERIQRRRPSVFLAVSVIAGAAMRGTQGALIVASTLQIIMGFSGLWRIVVRQLIPLSAAPLVALVGFGLYELGFPSVAKCIEIGLPEIILLVALSQYIPHLVPLLGTAFERFAIWCLCWMVCQ